MVGPTLFLTQIIGNVPYVHLGNPTVRPGTDHTQIAHLRMSKTEEKNKTNQTRGIGKL